MEQAVSRWMNRRGSEIGYETVEVFELWNDDDGRDGEIVEDV